MNFVTGNIQLHLVRKDMVISINSLQKWVSYINLLGQIFLKCEIGNWSQKIKTPVEILSTLSNLGYDYCVGPSIHVIIIQKVILKLPLIIY